MDETLIECRNLWFAYNGQTVLEDITCDVRRGDFMAVIGPNGGGKTTLLKLMLGLLTPSRGTLRVFGRPPDKTAHKIGYVPQNVAINLHFPISVLDVVLMGCLAPGAKRSRPSRSDRQAAQQTLAQMGVDGFAHRRISALSGGQRQRVFIARALVCRPEILLLDEPTAGIDPQGQTELYALLKQLNKDITIVIVSHDMLALSTYIKSVACVNHRLYYHDQTELTQEMIDTIYPYALGESCPVELVAHGVPHRVLQTHKEK